MTNILAAAIIALCGITLLVLIFALICWAAIAISKDLP